MARSVISTHLIFKKGAQKAIISMHIFKEVQVSKNTDHKHCLNTKQLYRCCPRDLQGILTCGASVLLSRRPVTLPVTLDAFHKSAMFVPIPFYAGCSYKYVIYLSIMKTCEIRMQRDLFLWLKSELIALERVNKWEVDFKKEVMLNWMWVRHL